MASTPASNPTDQRLAFIEFALDAGVLQFGDFKLKSGRNSPYFFNAGLFKTGQALASLGRFYASAIVAAAPPFDVLMGPAYKGIPIASATAVALADHHQIDVPWCFNRKEVKDHGEGGAVVGAELTGRVLIVDDVITAGTAIGEAHQIVTEAGAELAGIVVAMDRLERGAGEVSAVREVEQAYRTSVTAMSTLDDIVTYLEQSGTHREHLDSMRSYREAYAAS